MCKVSTNILYKTKGDLIPSKSTPSPRLGKIMRKREGRTEKEERRERWKTVKRNSVKIRKERVCLEFLEFCPDFF